MRLVCVVIFALLACDVALADSCRESLAALEAPVRLKSHSKPRRADWKKVDKVLNQLGEDLQGADCSVKFEELFDVRDDEPLFPLTNTVLRLVPEETLLDLDVYDQDGDPLGRFAGKSRYERSGGLYASRTYTLFFFQYRTADGELRSSGHDLLLDRFLVRWADLLGRTALTGSESEEIQ